MTATARPWWKCWWMWGFSLLMGAAMALPAAVIIAVPVWNTPGEAPRSSEIPFARWTSCSAAAASSEVETHAMRVHLGVVLRTVATNGGADTVLVTIRRYRDAERFLAALGCTIAQEEAP